MNLTVIKYAVAVASIVVAIAIRLLLDPFLGPSYPFSTITLVFVFCLWYCGRGPAITALVLGLVAGASKPIVGLRTACHAFQKADNEIIDRQIFGGHYGGGEGSSNGAYRAATAKGAADHPILKGVTPFKANKYYYANGKLADDAVVLQVFESAKYGKLPVTWVHSFKGGGCSIP